MRIIGRRGWAGALSLAIGLGTTALGMPAETSPAAAAGPRVLLVGSFHGVQGQYSSVQAAVDAARPGDWILIGPDDYHETADESPTAAADSVAHGNGGFGGVLITTADLHLRGMNRTSAIIDGTKAGAPKACDPSPRWQNFGAAGPGATRRPQQDCDLQGQRGERSKSHRLQLPRRHGRHGQRDLVERRGPIGQGRAVWVFGQLPGRHLHVLRTRWIVERCRGHSG